MSESRVLQKNFVVSNDGNNKSPKKFCLQVDPVGKSRTLSACYSPENACIKRIFKKCLREIMKKKLKIKLICFVLTVIRTCIDIIFLISNKIHI